MGEDHLDKTDEIVIPSTTPDPPKNTLNGIPDSVPDHKIQHLHVTWDGDDHHYRIVAGENGTRVGAIKDDLGAGDAIARYTDTHGKKHRLNDDDVIADHLDDGDTLVFQTDAIFG